MSEYCKSDHFFDHCSTFQNWPYYGLDPLLKLSHTKWEDFEPYHTYFAGISDEAWRDEQNGSKIHGFSGDVLNMDVELSRKLAERKQMEKKVDGGGDIIEVHRRLEEDVDESGNEQNNVPDSNNVEKQELDNEAIIAGETVGDVDQHTHETEIMKDNLPNFDE